MFQFLFIVGILHTNISIKLIIDCAKDMLTVLELDILVKEIKGKSVKCWFNLNQNMKLLPLRS